MNFLAILDDHVGKLLHPETAGKPVEAMRHRYFLATRFAVSLTAMVVASLYLATRHAPAWWQACALAELLLPFVAALYVSRTGNLAGGQALSFASWIALASTLALGAGSGSALGLLLLVPLEAALTGGSLYGAAAMALAGTVSILAAVAVGFETAKIADAHAHAHAHASGIGSAILAAAVLYGVALAALEMRVREAKRDEERSAHDFHGLLFEAINTVVLRFDRSGMVVSASAASQRLFGVAPRNLLGRGFFEAVHVADRPALLKLVTDVASRSESRGATLRIRTGDTLPGGKAGFEEPIFAWVDLQARPIAGQSDIPGRARDAAVLGLMSDITAQKDQDEAAQQAARAARRDDAGRDLFLANVSHELRTPLNAIIGFADLLASESLGPRDPAKQKEYASIIQQSGQHLLAVVNSILDASKIESGSFAILPEPFDLGRLIAGCRDMVALKAESGQVAVSSDIAPGLREIIGDERACKQILLNLLSNAIKFTPAGGRVRVEARPDGASVILSVADTGVGVSARDLPRLGDPFFQANNQYDRPFDGTGLGLSVVRGLVDLHGGSMSIESAPGQGTRVAVRLPMDCRRAASSPSASKIETIPRYSLSSQPVAGPADIARIHRIA